MSETTHKTADAHRPAPAWLMATVAIMPGVLLSAWLMGSSASDGHLLGAAAALLAASIVLLTQPRTRWYGMGLVLGLALWTLTEISLIGLALAVAMIGI